MTPLDNILSHLEKVRQRQPGQFSAQCPGPNHAHGDKTPSLSIRETPEGSVLLYCFAGCSASEITGAIGIDLADLFPPNDRPPGAPKRIARLLTAGQALDLLAEESMLVAVASANVGHGVALTENDKDRVLQAAGKINWLREESRGHQHA